MEKRGNRDQMVVATKYSMDYQGYKGFDGRINANFAANGTKSLHMSVRDSLKKLQTDYIDLLYVHWYIVSRSRQPGSTDSEQVRPLHVRS